MLQCWVLEIIVPIDMNKNQWMNEDRQLTYSVSEAMKFESKADCDFWFRTILCNSPHDADIELANRLKPMSRWV